MPRFHYRLQPALDSAILRERDACGAFARARSVSAGERRRLDDLSAREQALRARAAGRVREQCSAVALVDAAAHLAALARARGEGRRSLERADGAATAARAEFARATGRRTALDRHRARARAAWAAQQELAAAAEFDEANARSQARFDFSWKDDA